MYINKNTLKKVIFYIAYTFLVFPILASRVVYIFPIQDLFVYPAIAFLLILFVVQTKKYNAKSIALVYILLFSSVASYYINHDKNLIVFLLLVVTSRELDSRELIRFDYCIKMVIIVFVLAMYALGKTNEFITIRYGVVRLSFGFSHANAFAYSLLSVLIEYVYVNQRSVNTIKAIIMFAIYMIICLVTDSRTQLMLFILFVIVFFLNRYNLDRFMNLRPVRFILKYAFLFFTGLSFFGAYLYGSGSELGYKLDYLFTKRLRYLYFFIRDYKVNLFGNNMVKISTEYASLNKVSPMILDNSYVNLLLSYGVIVFLIYYFLVRKLINNSYKRKDLLLIEIVFILMIGGLMELHFMRYYYNIFLICGANSFMNSASAIKNDRRGKSED